MFVKPLNIISAAAATLTLCIAFSFTAKSQFIYTIAGDGTPGNSGNGMPAVCASTPYTSGVCLDGKGNLYITCSNSIRKIVLATGIITTIAGSDTWGHTGDGGPAIAGTLQDPHYLCADKYDNLYVSEWGGNCIRKINTQNGIISTVAGTGNGGFGGDNGPAINAVMHNPEGICTDAAGNIYFTDNYNSRVRKINAHTGIITTIAGNGTAVHSGDGRLAINSGVAFPNDVKMDTRGNIYFTESLNTNSNRIRKIDAVTGIVTTIAGNNSYAHSGDGGLATAASLVSPSGLFVDKSGNIFISEYDDSRIRKVDAVTGVITTIAGNGTNAFTGDGGPAVNASLYYPKGLCADDSGNLYVADHASGRIRKISKDFTVSPSLHISLVIAAPATNICPGESVNFSATLSNAGANPQLSWQVNGAPVPGLVGTAYTSNQLQEGDVVSCQLVSSVCNNVIIMNSNAMTIHYKTNFLPEASITAAATSICAGQLLNITAVTKNAGTNPSYQWKLNGADAGTNSALFSSTAFVNGDKVNCVVTVDPVFACGITAPLISNTITVGVNSALPAVVTIAASAGNPVCAGDELVFTASTLHAGNAVSYQWKINEVPVGNNKNQFTYAKFANNDTVSCEISGAGVCPSSPLSSNAFVLQVNPLPAISVLPADTTVAPGTQLQLHAVVPAGISSYTWQPANALTSGNALSPLTRPLNLNTIFELSVTATNGCTAKSKISVSLFSKLLMPGAFTPNNDGLNDVFRIPPGTTLKLKRFSVYNRLGNLVFTTADISKGWDGNSREGKKETGVFVFIVSGDDDKGPVLLRGSFLLIR